MLLGLCLVKNKINNVICSKTQNSNTVQYSVGNLVLVIIETREVDKLLLLFIMSYSRKNPHPSTDGVVF